MEVALREVLPSDLDFHFALQADPVQAATTVPARERPAFDAWVAEMDQHPDREWLTITVDGEPVGNILSFVAEDKRWVGYRIAQTHWGRGIATQALGLFLPRWPRPLHALVLATNGGSRKVLQRNGFEVLQIEGDEVELVLS